MGEDIKAALKKPYLMALALFGIIWLVAGFPLCSFFYASWALEYGYHINPIVPLAGYMTALAGTPLAAFFVDAVQKFRKKKEENKK